MYIEYKYDIDRDTAKKRIDEYTDKLDDLQFSGGFIIEDLKKSWTEEEMQLSFQLKKMIIDRRIKGNFHFKDHLVIIELELPDIVRNFITDKNLERIIRTNLDNILK